MDAHHSTLTSGQLAMAAAFLRPEPGKRGRAKKSSSVKSLETTGFSKQRLAEARRVLRHSRPLAEAVLAGSVNLNTALAQIPRVERRSQPPRAISSPGGNSSQKERPLKQSENDARVLALETEVSELAAIVAALSERLQDVELTFVHNGKTTPRQIAAKNAEHAAEAERMRKYRERLEREGEAARAEHEKGNAAAAAEEERREREAEERRRKFPYKKGFESFSFKRSRGPFDS
jgi:hypothetical protein